MPEPIYRHPYDYDLEHAGDTADVDFFVRLAERLKARRVLELACGSGRVTIPLARAGAQSGFQVWGLEMVAEMLEKARERAAEAGLATGLNLVQGDMRNWQATEPFDLILTPCSSMCHLLSLDDQLAAWRQAHANVVPGGRFVVDVSMPNLAAYADSFTTPPRSVVEIDRDTTDSQSGERLIRSRTVRYLAHEQRAQTRFLYDRYAGTSVERFVSDYESHVYFPRELHLLFSHTGFTVESVYGDYRGNALSPHSQQMIFVGKKP